MATHGGTPQRHAFGEEEAHLVPHGVRRLGWALRLFPGGIQQRGVHVPVPVNTGFKHAQYQHAQYANRLTAQYNFNLPCRAVPA